ncbi:hypothetical protein [Streptomyces javensis]|uniref:Uncharacterized protein n=1 Tax=Streptomyces javensis TaxID=114698 RepID=A0ABS0R3L6_9ACTN|nr:hypothetical protein [Streptomyces javensis]MBI0311663.1 hypothetical protein [Streptomyces javensis]
MIEPSSGARPTASAQEPAQLLDELDTDDWKRAGSTAGSRASRTARRVHGSAPANTLVLDHLAACDGEVADFIAAARQAPVSSNTSGDSGRASVYRRARVQAEELGLDWKRYLEAMEWRHATSTALLMGDKDVIRPERCPACRTFGLVWVEDSNAAMCVNRYCAVRGQPRMWTLTQLAAEHVADRQYRVAN